MWYCIPLAPHLFYICFECCNLYCHIHLNRQHCQSKIVLNATCISNQELGRVSCNCSCECWTYLDILCNLTDILDQVLGRFCCAALKKYYACLSHGKQFLKLTLLARALSGKHKFILITKLPQV